VEEENLKKEDGNEINQRNINVIFQNEQFVEHVILVSSI
jgi:hypothetical protein